MANADGYGYCKMWKATSIVVTMFDLTSAGAKMDTARLENHLSGSLKMEGFSDTQVSLLTTWLFLEYMALTHEWAGHTAEREKRIADGSSRKPR